jgi:hypothetical protein
VYPLTINPDFRNGSSVLDYRCISKTGNEGICPGKMNTGDIAVRFVIYNTNFFKTTRLSDGSALVSKPAGLYHFVLIIENGF